MPGPLAIRKKLKRYELPNNSRFITCSCFRRRPLFDDTNVCRCFLDCLDAARRKCGFELFAWVIMPEHVHLLMRPRGLTLERGLRSVKQAVAEREIALRRREGRLDEIATAAGAPRFWQAGGGFDRNVRDESEFCRTVCYIHRNPVERGLVPRPQDWAWSSVRWWMGHRERQVVCDPPPGDPRAWAAWKGYM